jgi:5'(3')-deoxyribonucleotidase
VDLVRSNPLSATNDRFVLAVDLDGVCAAYTDALRPYMAALGRRDAFDLPEPEEFNLVTAGWFENFDQYMAAHRYAVERAFFRTMGEMPGMSDGLWELSEAEIHIRIVTHRFLTHGDQDRAAVDTIAWLQQRRPDGRVRVPYRDLCFLGAKADASADLHLDDAPHQIEALRAGGEQVLVFDQRYNRHLPGPRACGWPEVVEQVLDAQREWTAARSKSS